MSVKVGLTLFSYTGEYNTGKYNFDDCVREAFLAGAEGYEIVGSQMLPSYPRVSDEFLGKVYDCKAKYGIGPVSYGANQDRGKLKGRDLTDDELLALTILDLKAANKLGCKRMRVQYMMSPEAFMRLAPYAEAYDVRCGIEIHNPETPKSETILKYVDVIDKTCSKYLGFVLDFGCFATAPNKPKWDQAIKSGVDVKFLEMARDFRYEDVSFEEAFSKLKEAGAPDAIQPALQGMYGFVQFRKTFDAIGLKFILPYTVYCHGKYHYLDENGHEPAIPYEEILPALKETGYEDFLIGEFEDEIGDGGHDFAIQYLKMVKRILG